MKNIKNPKFNARVGTKITVKSHYRFANNKLMYVPKKDSDEIAALGILTEEFNQGYAKIQIQSIFEFLSLKKHGD